MELHSTPSNVTNHLLQQKLQIVILMADATLTARYVEADLLLKLQS